MKFRASTVFRSLWNDRQLCVDDVVISNHIKGKLRKIRDRKQADPPWPVFCYVFYRASFYTTCDDVIISNHIDIQSLSQNHKRVCVCLLTGHE